MKIIWDQKLQTQLFRDLKCVHHYEAETRKRGFSKTSDKMRKLSFCRYGRYQ